MLQTGCARERRPIIRRLEPPRTLLRTRFILDEDVNAPLAVNVEGLLISAEGKDGNTLMETDEHAAVIRRLYDAFFSQRRVALAEELHGPGFVYHDVTHPDQVVDLDEAEGIGAEPTR